MAQFQNIGSPVTIAAGATHYWEYWFGPGLDVGAAIATPNILDSTIKIRLTTSNHGVVTAASRGENPPMILYTVTVHNQGTFAVSYNLDVGNFQ
jgi:hypothetical protein